MVVDRSAVMGFAKSSTRPTDCSPIRDAASPPRVEGMESGAFVQASTLRSALLDRLQRDCLPSAMTDASTQKPQSSAPHDSANIGRRM